MMFANRMVEARKKLGLTQSEVADLYQISLDWLLTGKKEERVCIDFQDSLSDRLFNEEHMYTYVKTYANAKGMFQTSRVLPYARELHKGQVRKGNDQVPYIYHPLLITCHALALGLEDDNIVSAALLHDICEDCGVKVKDLPVNDITKEAVRLLTKEDGADEEEYYRKILENPIATMVKLLDRCNNISGMASGFSKEKLVEYIKETEKLIYPLLRKAKNEYAMYSNQIFLIKYHMLSVIEAIKHQG